MTVSVDDLLKIDSFHEVTPSKRQLKRGGSPSKSVIDTAKVKNKAIDKPKNTTVIERNSRAKRAERRVSFDLSQVGEIKSSSERGTSKRAAADETESAGQASKRQKAGRKEPEPIKKTADEKRERLLFGEESSSSKPIKLHLTIDLEMEEEQFVRIAKQLPGLLNLKS